MAGRSKRLSINISFLNLTDHYYTKAPKSPTKIFEEPNGVVGLGILAAITDVHHRDPIRILRNNSLSENNNTSKKDEMESCEEYTCVMSHVGDNLIEKREYFEAGIVTGNGVAVALEKVTDSDSDTAVRSGGEIAVFAIADFLNSCFLCDKVLHGLDIFMYRGEKAFCSSECRLQQITIDEKKDKHLSGRREYSVSPCSGTLHFLAGVAAA